MITGPASSMNRRIGIAALVVGSGVLASRVLGQVREIVFAGMLGADAVTDQYVAAFRIPDFLNYLLAGGFLSITFIPIFARYLAAGDEDGGWAALSAIIRPITAGICLLVVIGWVAAPTVIELVYPEFTEGQVTATVRLTRIVLPAQIFFVLGALLAAVQYAKGSFVIPSIAPVVYNAGIIIGGVGYAIASGGADPEGFIWGALAGAFVGNFALQWWGARRVGLRFVSGTGMQHPALREYVLIAIPLMIGQSIVVLDESFMSIFGDLAGDGAQTQLQYARRTMFVPVGVIAQAAAVATYPFLASLFAAGENDRLADAVDRALKWVLAASIGAAALIASLTVPAVRLLFERFQFTAEDTAATAAALFFFAFAIPVWGALQVLTRAFYAQRRMWAPVGVGTATTVAAIPLYWALQRSFGLRGVAVASVLALGGYTIVLAVIWYRDPTHRNRLSGVADTAGRSLIPAVAGGFAAFITARLVAGVLGESGAATFIAVVLSVAAFAAAAAGAINLLASGGVLVVESADRDGAAEDGTSGGPGPPPQAGG